MASVSTHVQILMATCNGSLWIDEQLESICNQSQRDWSLWCSDDRSSDTTPSKLAQFAGKMWPELGEVSVKTGPQRVFGSNFLSLLSWSPDREAFVAFADQDDVWLPEKLERAITALQGYPRDEPALYFSNRMIWDADQNKVESEREFAPRPSFQNALIENIAPGNTIVLNAAAASLARRAAAAAKRVVAHDWWLYLLITGVGGHIHYDHRPSIWYRQHNRNAIGHNRSLLSAVMRKKSVLMNVFANSVGRNIHALQGDGVNLTPANRALLAKFERCRRLGPVGRMQQSQELGLYRQGRIGQAGYFGAMALGKV